MTTEADQADQPAEEGSPPDLMAELAPLLRARPDLDEADVQYLEDVIRATLRRARTLRQDEHAAIESG